MGLMGRRYQLSATKQIIINQAAFESYKLVLLHKNNADKFGPFNVGNLKTTIEAICEF